MSCLGSINHKATFKHSMANVLIFSFSPIPVFHVLLAMINSTLHSFLLIVVFYRCIVQRIGPRHKD